MRNSTEYDCAIIGGGLAGLCLSIQMAKMGHSVILFEKNKYPFHRVCGEYISNESKPFLEHLGVPLSEMNLPQITKLGISSPKGHMLNASLNLGGFGISRYKLDAILFEIARQSGVVVLEDSKVHNVLENEGYYAIISDKQEFRSKVACGSYGKYTPTFMPKQTSKNQGNYIGVKYHILTDLASDRIELHNFKGGYCGVSQIEDSKFCLCYLTTADNLKQNDNNIQRLEENVLMKNPRLKKYLKESRFLFESPIVTSNIGFNKSIRSDSGLFLIGDAAGVIAPLCGNGMSMGMNASKMACHIISAYLRGQLSLDEAHELYRKKWNTNFSTRIKAGSYIQRLLGNDFATDVVLRSLGRIPYVTNTIIKLTHGNEF